MSKEFYQGQLAQAGNATAAIGVAQNLSAIFVMINGGPIDQYMYRATPIVVVPVVAVGMLFYAALIYFAYKREAVLTESDPDNLDGTLSDVASFLCKGRMTCVLATAVPVLWLAYSFSAHKIT